MIAFRYDEKRHSCPGVPLYGQYQRTDAAVPQDERGHYSVQKLNLERNKSCMLRARLHRHADEYSRSYKYQ